MFRKLLIASLVLALFALNYMAKSFLIKPVSAISSSSSKCSRIVSLAPNITEMLFALGLGKMVAGVTRYCDYPIEAVGKTKVGGYYDPNYEAIFSLKPDLVVMLQEHEEPQKKIPAMGLNILVLNNKTVDDILNSITVIGETCGVKKRAEEIVRGLKDRIKRIGELTKTLARPTVMVSVGRGMASNSIKNVYIAGKNGYYDELITLAGGVNVYQTEKIAFPVISMEGIVAFNPDVVLDLVPDVEEKGLDEKKMLKEWEELYMIKAVKEKRVYILGKDYVTVPGPRFILLLEDMVKAIHPEIKERWKKLL